ncbi:hypothetical protein [Thiocystis violascens]|uniref:Uncharacterized protein n=1 Tax=Thiocystis violascens (strain ATCC 17096 / DSM 198 / 6111) TaxID=765911 RepID=I3Y8M8_THIV6|nr:hypothetical protein [Thiocystis violascens]AFL73346.1 hypothetical protein Thivi_1333 [Thiocystis violascens DSM 198]
MSQNNYQQYPGAGQYAAGQAAGGYQGQGAMQPGLQQPYAYPVYYQQQQQQPVRSLLSMPNDRFVKGLLIGAAVTYLVTNEQVQRTLIKGVVKTWSLLQGGVEEVKERFGDAAAELHHGSQNKEG